MEGGGAEEGGEGKEEGGGGVSVGRNSACPKGRLPVACWLSVESAGRRFAQTPAIRLPKRSKGGRPAQTHR